MANEWERAISTGAEVIGLGVSGLAAAECLSAKGISPLTLRDRVQPHDPTGILPALLSRGARLITGDGYLSGLGNGLIVRSPSVRPDLPPLLAAARRGAVIGTEISLFLAKTPARVFAVTGSSGKTSTVTLLSALLRSAGYRVFTGGNIGASLLPRLPEMTSGDAVVLELSSFQLMDLSPEPFRAAILNLTENHLNWHRGMPEYIAAKRRILGRFTTGIFSADDPETLAIARERPGSILFSTRLSPSSLADFPFAASLYTLQNGMLLRADSKGISPLFSRDLLRLPGEYPAANLLAALALSDRLLPPCSGATVAASFHGVPHRMEQIATVGGVTCIDSSIDSTPLRTAATLLALGRRCVLLLGGAGKGLSFAPLLAPVARYADAVVLFGAAEGMLAEALSGLPIPVLPGATFDRAVRLALSLAKPGTVLLLSPACTSYDAFRNFEERGARFRALVAPEEIKT